MANENQVKRSVLSDPSLWILLLMNGISIFLALKENWNLLTVMWIYWFQSIVIGLFNFIRILELEEFSAKGFKINDHPAQPTEGTKYFTAFFFLFHYGLFHFVYSQFLLSGKFGNSAGNGTSPEEMKQVLLLASLFFVSHLFSYIYNKPKDTKRQNIGSLMMYPYARIIPMHFTIIFGSLVGGALPLFLALKTIADCVMHSFEHNVLRKGEEPSA